MTGKIDQTPIDVEAALKDSPYAKEAKKFAEQFENARITKKGMVHNAPLKLKKTFGADIYDVMDIIMKYEAPTPASTKKTKGAK